MILIACLKSCLSTSQVGRWVEQGKNNLKHANKDESEELQGRIEGNKKKLAYMRTQTISYQALLDCEWTDSATEVAIAEKTTRIEESVEGAASKAGFVSNAETRIGKREVFISKHHDDDDRRDDVKDAEKERDELKRELDNADEELNKLVRIIKLGILDLSDIADNDQINSLRRQALDAVSSAGFTLKDFLSDEELRARKEEEAARRAKELALRRIREKKTTKALLLYAAAAAVVVAASAGLIQLLKLL